jgi:creatinine amidohydrolase/Fe(II)-dependent formamide hydrolase-like protein
MMLHSFPELVQMDKAYRDMGQLKLKYFNWDHPEPSAFSYQAWWSSFSKEGICGDAAAATPQFGKLMFETTVTRFVEMVREFQSIENRPRVDHH